MRTNWPHHHRALQRVLRPVPGFLESIREACDRHGIVMIYDEIVTGFRLAWGGAQEAYGVVPDMAATAKRWLAVSR